MPNTTVARRFRPLVVMTNEAGWSNPLDFTACRGHVAKFFRLGRGLLQFNVDMAYYLHPDAHSGLAGPIGAQVISATDDALLEQSLDEIDPSHVLLWNGAQYSATVSRLRDRDISVVFCELGWFPQVSTFYFDTSGVGGSSSLRSFPLERFTVHPDFYAWRHQYVGSRKNLASRHDNFVFVPLQLERDSNILFYSRFQSMEAFVDCLTKKLPNRKLVVRPHPLDRERQMPATDNVIFDSQTPLDALIASCSAVVGINSTVLYEALLFEKPVFALGDTIAPPKSVFYNEGDLANLDNIIANNSHRSGIVDGFLSELAFRRQMQMNDLLSRDAILANHFWGRVLASAEHDSMSVAWRLGEELSCLDAAHHKVWTTYRHLEKQLKTADDDAQSPA